MKPKAQYIGCCVDNPFRYLARLEAVIENSRDITKQTFLKNCAVYPGQRKEIKEYPRDFTFHKSEDIYFYKHSAVEFFFRRT